MKSLTGRQLAALLAGLLSLLAAPFHPAVSAPADDILAHALYRDGDFARAAEVFVDPAWQGLALYRSGQWWRAIEVLLRADDPVSDYNLGNCYARLGYPALALDAYLRALERQPDLADAHFNAELMRRLLAEAAHDSTAGQTRDQPLIDRLAAEQPAAQGNAGDGEQDQGDAGETRGDRAAEPGTRQTQSERETATGAEPTDQPTPEDDPTGAGDRRTGRVSDTTDRDARAATGGTDSESLTEAPPSTGERTRSEQQQATEQWLNRIRHDPLRFLEKRIALESRRRAAAGQQTPDSGDAW